MKVAQIQIFPNKSQSKAIIAQIEEHRALYNGCLEKKSTTYELDKTNLSCYDLIKSEVKVYRNLSNCSAMQQTVRRLDKAFQKFFKGCKEGSGVGYPRKKSYGRFKTMEYSLGDGIKIKNSDKIYIQGVGNIFGDFSEVQSVRSLSVTWKNGKFYVNVGIDDVLIKVERTNRQVGLDVGLKTFITTSDGEKFDSPKFHKRSLREEGKIHRRIHRAPKGSKLRNKHKKSLGKIKNKIANRRKDFNHKLSRKIVDNNDLIVMEDIVLSELLTDIKNINRTYADVAIGQFRQYTSYKAEKAGKKFIKIPAYNTTKECFACGNLVEKTLKERRHKCSCGYDECRDVNAAKVILRRGLASLAKA